MDLTTNTTIASQQSDECVELKHIKYKTMIQNGANKIIATPHETEENLNTLEKFLSDTTESNKTERWNKLDKTVKLQKITQFIDVYAAEQNISAEECACLRSYLKECLDKKKLMRVKDVVYDNDEDKLTSIPGLQYNKVSKKYTIKNTDTKRGSVLRGLPQRKTLKLKNDKKPPAVTENVVVTSCDI